MFEARLKILLFGLGFGLTIVVARLIDMQIVHAESYRQQAENALLLPVKVIPTVRGRILDRTGKTLLSDEPCWDVRVDYGVLSMDPGYLKSRADRFRRRGYYGRGLSESQVERRLREDISRMWVDIARFSGESAANLRKKAEAICTRISAIRSAVARRRGFDTAVREERMRHAIVSGLDDQQQVAARSLLARYPWVRVEDSVERVFHVGEPFAHVLGRIGPVTAERLEADRSAGSPSEPYDAGDKLGVSGAERAAESLLRGRRGRFVQNRDGAIVEEELPEPGRDVHLTIRADLQEALYAMFKARSDALVDHPGGSIVVLDVATRDCLALISYPSFDPRSFDRDYDALRKDTIRQPLRFRAVANRYAPGSIVKPLTCLAGLSAGVITLDTRFTCRGSLFPEYPNKWRCWANRAGVRMRHGDVGVVDAIKHSCNVFLYKTGQLVGVQRLCNYFEMVGFGRLSGTHLVEEVAGINPTPSWLANKRGVAVTPGTARNFAIGQAEVSVTPLQAANLMAIYASGELRAINLFDEIRSDSIKTLPVKAAYWRAIRRGLYGVVNDADGTAHRSAYLEPSSGYALFGKTGSAQAKPWRISYEVPYVDTNGAEGVAVVPATTRNDAVLAFRAEHPKWAFDYRDVAVHERLPLHSLPPGRTYSHAWFVGYLQPLDGRGQPDWLRTPRIAFAVMVEFGGSGGRVSAPVGKKVAKILLQILGPDLDPNVPPHGKNTGGP